MRTIKILKALFKIIKVFITKYRKPFIDLAGYFLFIYFLNVILYADLYVYKEHLGLLLLEAIITIYVYYINEFYGSIKNL